MDLEFKLPASRTAARPEKETRLAPGRRLASSGQSTRWVSAMRLRFTVLMSVICIACGGAARAAELSAEKLPYPSAVALSGLDGGGWIYRSFPALLPLYIFDGEPAGTSACDKACTAVWPILPAEAADKPMGEWTIVKRDDGRLQWAFRNKPVYTYFEDTTNNPRGVGKDMDWYLDERGIAYLRSVGVTLPELVEQPERKRADDKNTPSMLLPTLK